VEIQTHRQTQDSQRSAPTHPGHAPGQSDLGQARIAAELLVKLGIKVSPRTVQKYLPEDPKGGRRRAASSQHWMTFVRNHAKVMLACDFFVSVTIHFRMMYVFVLMEVGSRRLLHFNVISYPTAAWTLQSFAK
jgi:putative transposase